MSTQFHKPESIEAAAQCLNQLPGEKKLIAGGSDLIVGLRVRQQPFPDHIIDISGIEHLRTISEDADEIVVGAGVTHDAIVHDPLINKYAPLLSDACRQIGSRQIRNRATIGGNICNASPCADSVPPLLALETEVRIISAGQEKIVPLNRFFKSPYRTILNEDELVSELRFKKLTGKQRSAFYKLGRRNAVSTARISVAVVLSIGDENTIGAVRIVPGSVFPVWQNADEAEQYLIGKTAEINHFQKAGELTAGQMIRLSGRRWSTPYKEPVVTALVKRTLALAAGIKFR